MLVKLFSTSSQDMFSSFKVSFQFISNHIFLLFSLIILGARKKTCKIIGPLPSLLLIASQNFIFFRALRIKPIIQYIIHIKLHRIHIGIIFKRLISTQIFVALFVHFAFLKGIQKKFSYTLVSVDQCFLVDQFLYMYDMCD